MRFFLPSFLSAAALAATAAIVPTAAPAEASTPSPAGRTVQVQNRGCTASVYSPFAQTQGTGTSPSCSGDVWTYTNDGAAYAAATSRSETHWGTRAGVTQYHEGDTVTYEADYMGNLGAAGQGDNDWHVLWQLNGPFGSTWLGPVLGLNVRHGQLRLGGGAGRPDQNWASRNYEWVYPLTAWKDGTVVRVKVQTYLSSNPDKGWVSAWINGRQVLNQVRPVSYSGRLRPGTWYSGLSFVGSRSGLYRGTQSGAIPRYRQTVMARIISAG